MNRVSFEKNGLKTSKIELDCGSKSEFSNGRNKKGIFQSRSVLLAGATGLVGGYCLRLLLDSPEILEVNMITRRPLNIAHPKLKEHCVEFSEMGDVFPQEVTWDAVFCCLGTTMKQAGSREEFKKVDLEYVIALAELGKKHQAEKFLVVSSMGASKNSPIFYSRIKGRMEAEISKIGYKSVDIFRPSFLVGHRANPRFGERWGEKAMQIINPVLVGPMRSYRSISAERIARVMVSVAARSEMGVQIYPSNEIQRLSSEIVQSSEWDQ